MRDQPRSVGTRTRLHLGEAHARGLPVERPHDRLVCGIDGGLDRGIALDLGGDAGDEGAERGENNEAHRNRSERVTVHRGARTTCAGARALSDPIARRQRRSGSSLASLGVAPVWTRSDDAVRQYLVVARPAARIQPPTSICGKSCDPRLLHALTARIARNVGVYVGDRAARIARPAPLRDASSSPGSALGSGAALLSTSATATAAERRPAGRRGALISLGPHGPGRSLRLSYFFAQSVPRALST